MKKFTLSIVLFFVFQIIQCSNIVMADTNVKTIEQTTENTNRDSALSYSTNLFNKNTVTKGYFAKYSDGTILTNANYSVSDYIGIVPDTTYVRPAGHEQQIAFYDANKKYISGLVDGSSFKTPSNAKYVRISLFTSLLDTEQLEKVTVSTFYESFNKYVTENKHKTVTVKKSGGDYSSIKAAINAVQPTKEYPVDIIIYEGTWTEELTGKDYVNLIGVDRKKTIIESLPTTGDYNNTKARDVIKANVNMTVKNLTINAKNTKYCIHADATVDSPNQNPYTLIIENCTLNKTTYNGYDIAIGAGLRADEHIVIKNSNINGDGGAVYVHNWNDQKSYSSLTVENSNLIGKKRCGLWIDSLGSNHNDLCILKNNTIKGGQYDLVTKNRLSNENVKYHGKDDWNIVADGNIVTTYEQMNGSLIKFIQ